MIEEVQNPVVACIREGLILAVFFRGPKVIPYAY